MRRFATRTLLIGVVAAIPFLATSALGAGTSLGTAFTPTVGGCTGFTDLQTGGGNYRVPSAGVVTSWEFAGGATAVGTVSFKVGRAGAAPTTYTIVGSSAPVAGVANEIVGSDVRIPAQAGDVIGLSVTGANGQCARGATGFDYVGIAGDATGTGTWFPGSGFQFDMKATLEPDADGDGFGDISQDRCSTDKTTQAACGTGAPETTLGSLTAKKAKKANKKAAITATFSASEASTFECAVDSASFAPCASPFTAKLKVGTHSFAVRATDTAGNLDRTAAVQTFKIKVAKKKK